MFETQQKYNFNLSNMATWKKILKHIFDSFSVQKYGRDAKQN